MITIQLTESELNTLKRDYAFLKIEVELRNNHLLKAAVRHLYCLLARGVEEPLSQSKLRRAE